ncbi:MAG: hypothetical protein OEY59_01030 [Deltaproteobacteria bacterium]|nr:hypothetical protein [Deltaproteobacteria bacterium]
MALSNNVSALVPTILARGLRVLRNRVLMTRMINLDYSREARQKGDTIDIPIASARTATDVVPAAVSSDPENSNISKVQVTLNNWKKANFGLTDSEMGRISANKDFLPLQMEEAFQALASKINQSVFSEYKGIYGYVGTAGTTPFGTGIEVKSATDARKLLNLQKSPREKRRAVLDFDAEAQALGLAPFSDAEKTGSSDTKITGEIGRKFGIDWFADDDVPTHSAGTVGGDGTTATVIKSATPHALAVKSLSVTVGATNGLNLFQGDILTIAGDSQTYVVTADVSQSAGLDVSIAIEPGLKVALSGSEEIQCKQSHVVNLAFHRDAFALAMRAPGEGVSELVQRPNSFTISDPYSGLVMRLEIIDQYKQTMWELDALWGVKLVRPELAVRIAG